MDSGDQQTPRDPHSKLHLHVRAQHLALTASSPYGFRTVAVAIPFGTSKHYLYTGNVRISKHLAGCPRAANFPGQRSVVYTTNHNHTVRKPSLRCLNQYFARTAWRPTVQFDVAVLMFHHCQPLLLHSQLSLARPMSARLLSHVPAR